LLDSLLQEKTMTESETSDPFRSFLKIAVSGLLTELGFNSAESAALETLTELTQSFIVELGRSARGYCELACRVEPVSADILLALVEMGVPVSGIQNYAQRGQRVTIPAPSQLTTPKQTSILHTGNNKKHPSSIPDNLPEFPDSHSYIRTPTHRQPVTDYEMVREKAASQKRDVERALTRFIAKTGKIHNLFKTDDNNLFPLISCEREVDGTKMPPYLNAILFKDQVFEEDEREFSSKKRKSSEKDTGDDGDKKSKLDESFAEEIDNPFLRPVKMPRLIKTPGKKAE